MKYINKIFFLLSLLIIRLSNAVLPELHNAVFDGNLEQVKLLLDAGEDVNVVDQEGNTPLHTAIMKNQKAIVNLFLERSSTKVNIANKWGHTPLHNAAYIGNEAIVNLLLEKGANVNAFTNLYSTPLHWAVSSAHKSIVELLVKRGADLSVTSKYGYTPLRLAERRKDAEMTALLMHWPKYQNLFRKRKKQMFSFIMATHPHIGVDSPAKVLPRELFSYIWEFVKPTIEEAGSFKESNFREIGIIATIIAGLRFLIYQLFKRR